MERHECRLADTEDKQPVGQRHQSRMLGNDLIGEHAVDDVCQMEIQITDQYVGQHHGRQQEELGSTHQIDDVLACSGFSIRILMVIDQRIREEVIIS